MVDVLNLSPSTPVSYLTGNEKLAMSQPLDVGVSCLHEMTSSSMVDTCDRTV